MDYNKILNDLIISHKDMDIHTEVGRISNNLKGLETYKTIFVDESITKYLNIAYDEMRPGREENKYDLFIFGMGQSNYINKSYVDYKIVQELYKELLRLNNNFKQLGNLCNVFNINSSELVFKLEEFDVIKNQKIDKISLMSLHDYYEKEYQDFFF